MSLYLLTNINLIQNNKMLYEIYIKNNFYQINGN